MPTLTHAPADLVVAISDGIAVRFAGLQLGVLDWQGTSGTAVTLEAVRGEETQARDLKLDDARKAWAARVASLGAGEAGEAPVMPGVAVLSAVRVQLTDDVGTAYVQRTGSVAGDGGTEWRATWFFGPPPPATTQELRLKFTAGSDPLGADTGATTGFECRVRLT